MCECARESAHPATCRSGVRTAKPVGDTMPACDATDFVPAYPASFVVEERSWGRLLCTWQRCNKQPLHDVAIGPLKNAVLWVGTNDCHAAATAKRFCPMHFVGSKPPDRSHWPTHVETNVCKSNAVPHPAS